MTHEEYFEALLSAMDNEIVVCALGENGDGWWKLTESRSAFYQHGFMGFASSFALGLALSLPEERVWVLNSDGGIAMNLGGLLTEAAWQPPNLLHVILNNHCYQCLRGAELVNAERTDYAAVAHAMGIANVYAVTSHDDLRDAVHEWQGMNQHALIVADVEPRGDALQEQFQEPTVLPFEGPEIKYQFGRAIEERTGRQVFGPSGY